MDMSVVRQPGAEQADPKNLPIVNIVGEKVALGPLRRDLIHAYHVWFNDFPTVRTFGGVPRPRTMEQQTAWYERMATDQEPVFTIYKIASWHPIGITSWVDVDYRNRTAEYSIRIGEQQHRGKGYGTETTQLMLNYAFTVLGLHSVMLKVYEYNSAGFHAYKKAGFREIGQRRQCQLMDGRLWDEIYMECLATEFTNLP